MFRKDSMNRVWAEYSEEKETKTVNLLREWKNYFNIPLYTSQ